MDEAVFWTKTRRSDTGCLEWTGFIMPNGYGQISEGKKRIYVHRRAWEMVHGPIPAGMSVCHHCDNRRCVQVAADDRWPNGHLFLGTTADNLRDMASKGRSNYGVRCPTHILSEEDVLRVHAMLVAGLPIKAIAASFAVSKGAIDGIARGKSWRHLVGPVPIEVRGDHQIRGEEVAWLAKLTPKQVTEIRQRAVNGQSVRSLVEDYGVSDSSIRAVIKRRTWRHVP